MPKPIIYDFQKLGTDKPSLITDVDEESFCGTVVQQPHFQAALGISIVSAGGFDIHFAAAIDKSQACRRWLIKTGHGRHSTPMLFVRFRVL